jgi:hypothetical protein
MYVGAADLNHHGRVDLALAVAGGFALCAEWEWARS